MLTIEKDISGATNQIAQEIKQYADAIRVFRNAIVLDYPQPVFMSLNYTNLVEVMHAGNVSVYAGVLRNEFQNFLFDYLADPYVELATFVEGGVDGVVTDYPVMHLLMQLRLARTQRVNFPTPYFQSSQGTCSSIWCLQNHLKVHQLCLHCKQRM